MQLFTLPYAGGQASFYKQLEVNCDSSIEFVNLDYPGHGRKIKERLCESFDEIVDVLYKELSSRLSSKKYAIIGYSMGALILVSLLEYIQSNNEISLPCHVFICSHGPHKILNMRSVPDSEIEDYVKAKTMEFDAIPNRLINNNAFWRTYLPIFKADYTMIDNFDIDSLSFNTIVPLTVMYGKNDVISKDIFAWNNYFMGNNEYYEFDGGHFFIYENNKAVARIINREILNV